jgi:hypothetical protein
MLVRALGYTQTGPSTSTAVTNGAKSRPRAAT